MIEALWERMETLRAFAKAHFERRLLVYLGTETEISEVKEMIRQRVEPDHLFFLGGELGFSNLQTALGRELSFIFYDGFARFEAKAFGIVTGALSAGGLLVLALGAEQEGESFFLKRLRRILFSDLAVEIWQGREQIQATDLSEEQNHFANLKVDWAKLEGIFVKPEAGRANLESGGVNSESGGVNLKNGQVNSESGGVNLKNGQVNSETGQVNSESDRVNSEDNGEILEDYRAICGKWQVFSEGGFDLNREQFAGVRMIEKTAQGGGRRPTIILGKRGRGKSTVMGLAAVRFLWLKLLDENDRDSKVIVVAPSKGSVEPFYRAAKRCLERIFSSNADLILKRILYYPLGVLLELRPDAALLMVDEAAAFPVSQLELLLRRYRRIVFGTTVQGYEGTGKGFLYKFEQLVEKASDSVRRCVLRTPLRYREGDPVEALTERLLLLGDGLKREIKTSREEAKRPKEGILKGLCPLNTRGEPLSEVWSGAPAPSDMPNEVLGGVLKEKTGAQAPQILEISQAELAENEGHFAELFSLLSAAHYRTSSFDLQWMLEAKDLSIFEARVGGEILGALILQREAPISEELAEQVMAGVRRPQGHLIQSDLAMHGGAGNALFLKTARVVRIAVVEEMRRRGIGKALLSAVEEKLRVLKFDLFASSFGATVDLLTFWQNTGFRVLRLGIERGESTGLWSAVVGRALSERGEQLVLEEEAVFGRRFSYALLSTYQKMEPELALALIRSVKWPEQRFDARDWSDLKAVAFQKRGILQHLGLMRDFFLWILSLNPRSISLADARYVIKVLIQRDLCPDLSEKMQLKQVESILQSLLSDQDLRKTLGMVDDFLN